MISAEAQSLALLWLAGGVSQVPAAAEDGSLPKRQRLAGAQAVEDKDIHCVLHRQDLLSLFSLRGRVRGTLETLYSLRTAP